MENSGLLLILIESPAVKMIYRIRNPVADGSVGYERSCELRKGINIFDA
jgi:hypothetical protein